jgi:hypothetical protein
MTDESNRAPRDVVPPTGPDLETFAALNRMVGRTVTVTEPGDLLEDADGWPLAVGPPRNDTATLAGATFTLAELEAAGGRPEDYPHLTFIDTRNGGNPA